MPSVPHVPHVPDPEDVKAYYDRDRKEYLMENIEGIWIARNETQCKRLLRSKGYSTKHGDNLISPAEQVLLDIEEKHTVSYAGPLAGKKAGYYVDNRVQILVTESIELVEPVKGTWDNIKTVIYGLLGEGIDKYSTDQIETFIGWLRVAVNSLHSGNFQPGQAVALAGEAACGKSLMQQIITEVLGGRSAKPAQYLTGKTNFNAELFGAEHLMLEDESMTPNMQSRRALGDAIKNTVVNEIHSCAKKHRTPVNLKPWWRLSISVNDDPESLMVLPPLDDSITDKITLLHAHKFEMPMDTTAPQNRKAFWKILTGEVPSFCHYLLNSETPSEFTCSRYGVKTWQNPELIELIDGLSQEAILLGLIDESLFRETQAGEWRGTANELRRLLLADPDTKEDFRRTFSWHNATGTNLGKLAKKQPDRVIRKRSHRTKEWIVKPPNDSETFHKTGGAGVTIDVCAPHDPSFTESFQNKTK